MEKTDKIWQEEQDRVTNVVKKIKQRINILKGKVGIVKEDVVDIRKKFWDDVTVNLENDEESAETFASIKQQAEVLSERERRHEHDVKQLKGLHRLKESPYFGKIQFLEDGEGVSEPIYIGTASFVSENGFDFYVYDWRAPISSLYYDSGPGEASYQTPVGEICGTIEEKKQFIIRKAQIEHMFNTGITIGDEMLQEVLGAQANTQMKSIVATIQQEQNQIIRNERSRVLIVQGVAGSGKTSAAMQRVAYLLYRYRHTLKAEQIVLFSPNLMFNSYVSSVLPELGEENMQQTTFQEYIDHRLGQQFTLEDSFSQMEYMLTKQQDDKYQVRLEGIQLKSSMFFMEVMDHYVDKLKKTGLPFNDINFRGETLFSGETISGWFYGMEQTLSIPNRIQLVTERLLKELRKIERKERSKEWVEREIELLDKDKYVYAFNRVERQMENNDTDFYDYDREEKILSAMVVKRSFKPVRQAIKQLQFINVLTAYSDFLNNEVCHLSKLTQGKQICEQTIENLNKFILPFEDATPYLYLKGKLEGFEMNTVIRHVFIDEAQDYSPFQFAFIKSVFPRAKLTVLGDIHQSIYTHSLRNDFAKSLKTLFPDEIESYQLTKSYRSTRQIVECTRGIIKAEIVPFNRNGKKPILTKHNSQDELLQWVLERIEAMKDDGHRTIAILCKTAAESTHVYNQLRDRADVQIMSNTSGYEEGVLIIPSYLAKGIEFDAVIVYNASKKSYFAESERNLFYTICTRAMHILEIGFIDEMSPFLENIPTSSYDLK